MLDIECFAFLNRALESPLVRTCFYARLCTGSLALSLPLSSTLPGFPLYSHFFLCTLCRRPCWLWQPIVVLPQSEVQNTRAHTAFPLSTYLPVVEKSRCIGWLIQRDRLVALRKTTTQSHTQMYYFPACWTGFWSCPRRSTLPASSSRFWKSGLVGSSSFPPSLTSSILIYFGTPPPNSLCA